MNVLDVLVDYLTFSAGSQTKMVPRSWDHFRTTLEEYYPERENEQELMTNQNANEAANLFFFLSIQSPICHSLLL